jgi:hypothetical protein
MEDHRRGTFDILIHTKPIKTGYLDANYSWDK